MMNNKISSMEIDEFIEFTDKIINDLEAGKIKSNPLESTKESVNEADGNEVVVEETIFEESEETISKNEPIYVGKLSKQPIKVTSKEGGVVIYGNAAEASRHTNIHQTTVRNYAKDNKVDKNGNTWSYGE